MTNEDRQRTMDFILQHQAKLDASIQRHDEYFRQLEEERIRDRPRLAELEKSFKRVVELLEIQESRIDRVEIDTAAVERRTMAIEINMERLAAAQAHADERLNALINIVMEDRGRAS